MLIRSSYILVFSRIPEFPKQVWMQSYSHKLFRAGVCGCHDNGEAHTQMDEAESRVSFEAAGEIGGRKSACQAPYFSSSTICPSNPLRGVSSRYVRDRLR